MSVREQSSIKSAVIHTAANPISALRTKTAGKTRLSIVLGYMMALEFLLVAASTYSSSVLYHYTYWKELPESAQYIGVSFFVATMFTTIALGFRHFRTAKNQQLPLLLWSGIGTTVLAFTLFLATVFLLKISREYSRGAFISEIVGVSLAICIFRATFILWLRSAIATGVVECRRAIVVGDASRYSKLNDEFNTVGARVVDWIPPPQFYNTRATSGDTSKFALNAYVSSAINLCRMTQPDDVVILAEQDGLSLATDLAHTMSELPCNIHIAPLDNIKFVARPHVSDFGGILTLLISRPPLSSVDLLIKRVFDITVAIIALIVLSPLLVTVGLTIKLDSRGNIFFRQKRNGYNNKVIGVFKFRTMTTAEDSDVSFVPTLPNDSRVTLVGRILRRTSIDELPQLFNVLLGDMSIVGPRPHAITHNYMFEDKIMPYARRHNVKPGITGWAQVNGYRGAADTIEKMQQRIEHDLYYIENWSFFFDLKIIIMTLFSKRAYMNAY
jgi:Undecaprenyl-phosphate glucose phosphotransferase